MRTTLPNGSRLSTCVLKKDTCQAQGLHVLKNVPYILTGDFTIALYLYSHVPIEV